MIKAIIFDAGEVLFNSKRSLFTVPIEYISRVTGRGLEEVDKAYREVIIECERKEVKESDFWKKIMVKLNVDGLYSKQDPIGEGFKVFRKNEEVFSLLESLRLKYLLAVVSNANSVEAGKIQAKEMYKHFDVVVLSFQIGVRKPDPKIYEVALNKLNAKASEVVFVDNVKTNIEEAKKLGFHGVLFKDVRSLKVQLSNLGVSLDI